MPTRLGDYFSSHRILVSRFIGLVFFTLALVTESAHEGSMIATALFLFGLMLAVIGTVGRLWCSLYISGYKDSQLVSAGPYSLCRNPLYFFSWIGVTGIGFATETFTLGIVLSVLFLIGYVPVIKSEEAFLQSKFGAGFSRYCALTPRFFPRLSLLTEPDSWTVNPRLFRRTMGDVIWFGWIIGFLEFVEALHELHILEPLLRLP